MTTRGSRVLCAKAAPRLGRLPEVVRDLPRDTRASAFSFVCEHPGQAYLPYHPLVSLMAEERAYHVLLNTQSQQYFEYLVGGTDLTASDAADASFLHLFRPTCVTSYTVPTAARR